MHYREIITVEPGRRGGKPCIRGLRITVYDILEFSASKGLGPPSEVICVRLAAKGGVDTRRQLVETGTVAWPGGLDLAPDGLYRDLAGVAAR